jgi:predicted GNAT family acetyltransferase
MGLPVLTTKRLPNDWATNFTHHFESAYEGRLTQQARDAIQHGKLNAFYVAYFSGLPVGFTAVYSVGEEKLGITVVLPNFRGQGIGTKLLKRRVKEVAGVLSKVSTQNEPSIKLCEAVGLRRSACAYTTLRGIQGIVFE